MGVLHLLYDSNHNIITILRFPGFFLLLQRCLLQYGFKIHDMAINGYQFAIYINVNVVCSFFYSACIHVREIAFNCDFVCKIIVHYMIIRKVPGLPDTMTYRYSVSSPCSINVLFGGYS